MYRPLRLQILLPAASLLIVAVCVNALFAAVWSSWRTTRNTTLRLEQIGRVLAETSFPKSPTILAKLSQLTDAEIAVWNTSTRELVSTLDSSSATSLESLLQASPRPSTRSTLHLGTQKYLLTPIPTDGGPRVEELFVLIPERAMSADQLASALPALIVGATSLLVLIPMMLHVARRLGSRISHVQLKVAAVAEGNYEPITTDETCEDEVHYLLLAVNELSSRLREFQARIETVERERLIGQFAGGLAHQLRNAITGAKLAVQLHQRRCASSAADESLAVALKQLALTEQQLRGLLSLGRRTAPRLSDCDPAGIVRDVVELLSPSAEHLQVQLVGVPSGGELPRIPLDRDDVLSALLNLGINALEACDRDGQVELQIEISPENVVWIVRDNGAGPEPHSASQIFEPFVTTKPEGVGLGLALARRVASAHGGELHCQRVAGWTEFRLAIPLHRKHHPASDIRIENSTV